MSDDTTELSASERYAASRRRAGHPIFHDFSDSYPFPLDD